MAAQRNYLQSLEKEVAGSGVFVGRLYISALIKNSAIDQAIPRSAGQCGGTLGGQDRSRVLVEQVGEELIDQADQRAEQGWGSSRPRSSPRRPSPRTPGSCQDRKSVV